MYEIQDKNRQYVHNKNIFHEHYYLKEYSKILRRELNSRSINFLDLFYIQKIVKINSKRIRVIILIINVKTRDSTIPSNIC